MQNDKFEQAELLLAERPMATSSPVSMLLPKSPVAMRKGTSMYWRTKYNTLEQAVKELGESSREISLDQVPGFLELKKVQPKKNKDKPVRVTQVKIV